MRDIPKKRAGEETKQNEELEQNVAFQKNTNDMLTSLKVKHLYG